MRIFKRPRMMNQERTFDETPVIYLSKDEIIQRSCNFMKRVKEFCNKETFVRFVHVMRAYQCNSISSIDLKTKVPFILRNYDFLLEEFHQLMSYSETKEKNPKPEKSDLERMVKFMTKVKALGKGLDGTLLNAIKSNFGDSQALINQLNVILRDHTSLKDEFISFLMDFGLLENPKHDLDAAGECKNLIKSGLLKPNHGLECMNITPSYSIRLEAKKKSSSCNGILNERYVSKGEFDQTRATVKRFSLCERRMNNLEDKLMKEDMYLGALTSVVEFGNRVFSHEELNEKPPMGFDEVLRRFYEDKGKIVPRSFRRDPKRAVQDILGNLQDQKEKMIKAKELRVRKVYELQQQKNNVY